MNIDITHGIMYGLRTLVVLIMVTATTGIAKVCAQGIDPEVLESVVSSYNATAEVLGRAILQDENLNTNRFAEVLQEICAERNRHAFGVVVEQIDIYARARTLQLREDIYRTLANDALFEEFLVQEDNVMREAGFSMVARQLAVRFMRTHREIAVRSQEFRLTERDTQTVIQSIGQLCERSDDQTLIIIVTETSRENTSNQASGVLKLVGGLALVAADSFGWFMPPVAAMSTALGGIITGSGIDEIW
ncbi:MAG: hypothetical protein OXF56_23965 [Rhodobacteraceae bacterium]|nr:hypothetical protein [Paracoccaceae bacterium]